MPYNSTAFQKQLAKHRAAEAARTVKADASPDPHVVRARASAERGVLKPAPIDVAAAEEAARKKAGIAAPVLRSDQFVDDDYAPIIVRAPKKPVYARGWFVFVAFTVLSTAAVPIFFKDEMKQVIAVGDSVKTSTGVDPFSPKTYLDMARGKMAANPPQPSPNVNPVPYQGGKQQTQPTANTTDMHAVVDQAQERAADVVSKGPAQSMQYIQSETQRLQKMAKEFDDQYNPQPK